MIVPVRRSSLRLANPLIKSRRRFHTDVHTLVNPTAQTISTHIESLECNPSSTVGLYLLHPDLEKISSVLKAVQSGLQNRCQASIGSFARSSVTATTTHEGSSLAQQGDVPFVTIATFTPTEPTEFIVPFRSTLIGRPPASVGRWHRVPLTTASPSSPLDQDGSASHPSNAPREPRQEDRKGEQVGEVERVLMGSLGYEKGEGIGWEGLWRSERLEGMNEELKGLEGLDGVIGVDSMLLLSDGLPNSTLASLDRHFPYASKLGLLTESTPFLTNRPYTLFENESVHESGAVGLAFCDSQHGGSGHVGAQYVARTNVEMGIEYPGLETLSGIETIDHAQGNLLLTIYPSSNASFEAQTNPTQLLIRAINEYNARSKAERPSDAANAEKGVKLGKRMKEEEWYLAIWGVDQDARHQPPRQVVRIMSGDPSRGALSLEMEEPLRRGQPVQFMHRPRPTHSNTSTPGQVTDKLITFTTLPQQNDLVPQASSVSGSSTSESISAALDVGTEGGFFYSPAIGLEGGKRGFGSVCKVVGARGWMSMKP